jgi:uncharacterized Tic20 family protein
MTMENNEQTPQPAEKPQEPIPAAEPVSAEKPQEPIPVAEPVSAEKAESEASVKQEVCNEKAGTANQSPGSKEANKDARMWAMICHLSGLAGIILPASGNIVAPLIIWQIKKDSNPFIDEQGKEAVNFQISMSIYLIASIILCFLCVGAFLVVATIIVFFVFTLIAAVKANNGYHYRYPLTMRFIK